jgi:dCMP deaminase
MVKRPTWDDIFMAEVEVLETRVTCLKFKVGAVFVKGKDQRLTAGYNGPPRGEPHCADTGCAKETGDNQGRCRGCHAEMNGIVNSALNGICLAGCKVYCSFSPCYECAKHLVGLGISEFIYREKYEKEFVVVKELFERRNILLRQFNPRRLKVRDREAVSQALVSR